ncbi:MAG TPA: Hsp20/alpha crystallin family protein [Thermoguttaceae bacterium]|nr:Hsp20/alpha crystallin family protein [Thermoguttaceae bacterium]
MVFRYTIPRHPIHQLRDEMDRLLSGAWPGGPLAAWARREGPAVNVWEADDALMVEMEVPGVKNENLDISVVENELVIRVELPETEQQGVTYHRRERPVGSFDRHVPLPFEVDAEHVSAELSRGVLRVTLPKVPSAKPRKIEVKVGGQEG